MIKVTEEEKTYLKETLPNADALLLGKLNDLLDDLNMFMVTKGLDKNQDLNQIGRKAEKVYDAIFYRNASID